MIEFIAKGNARKVSYPEYGKQDVGIAPYGAMDMFSFITGTELLGDDAECYEFSTLNPVIQFTEDCSFVITGAHRDMRLSDRVIERAKVITAKAGDILKFKKAHKGFRTYISIATGHRNILTRQPFYKYTWQDKDGYIRVIEGPEFHLLEDPEQMLSTWKVGAHNDMGMRLIGNTVSRKRFDMVSSPVADGTVQLSPSGPIILLRNRQTVGGYPRVLNVISADVDMLAQYHLNNTLKFRLVSMEEAIEVNKLKADELVAK